MLLTGLADSYWSLMFAASITGISVGINSPTIFAWTIDLAPDDQRGPGVSTMLSALEIGIIVSSLVAGFVYNNDYSMIPYVFWLCSGMALLALIILFTIKKSSDQYS